MIYLRTLTNPSQFADLLSICLGYPNGREGSSDTSFNKYFFAKNGIYLAEIEKAIGDRRQFTVTGNQKMTLSSML